MAGRPEYPEIQTNLLACRRFVFLGENEQRLEIPLLTRYKRVIHTIFTPDALRRPTRAVSYLTITAKRSLYSSCISCSSFSL